MRAGFWGCDNRRIMMTFNEIHFETIDSTNTYARENAGELEAPVLITADEQTRGRGRRGNSFYSPKDEGIYFTLLFEAEPGFDLVTPAAAVCVCESIKELTGKETQIKWVNDIFYEGKKVCGILCERFAAGERILTAAGIGINLTMRDFPAEIPQAGSLGVSADGRALARDISRRILETNSRFDREKILGEYRKRLFILGHKISFVKNGETFEGIAEDINTDCNLTVKTAGGYETLKSGEISVKIRECNK